jgi:hypothetical protein
VAAGQPRRPARRLPNPRRRRELGAAGPWLPAEQGWFTVKRQAFCADAVEPVGLYLGTTGGELWASGDEGESWRQIAAHLPEIYSVTVAETP